MVSLNWQGWSQAPSIARSKASIGFQEAWHGTAWHNMAQHGTAFQEVLRLEKLEFRCSVRCSCIKAYQSGRRPPWQIGCFAKVVPCKVHSVGVADVADTLKLRIMRSVFSHLSPLFLAKWQVRGPEYLWGATPSIHTEPWRQSGFGRGFPLPACSCQNQLMFAKAAPQDLPRSSKCPCRTTTFGRLLVWCCCWHFVDQKMAHGVGQIKASILSMVRRRYTDIIWHSFVSGCDVLGRVGTCCESWWLWQLSDAFGCLWHVQLGAPGRREVDSWTCATMRWTDMSKQVGNLGHVLAGFSWVMLGHVGCWVT